MCKQQIPGGEAKKKKTVPVVPLRAYLGTWFFTIYAYIIVHTTHTYSTTIVDIRMYSSDGW